MKRRTIKRSPAADARRPARRDCLVCSAFVLYALSACGGVAAQEQAPSNDELRSMYCVEVIRAEIALQRHLISASDAAAGSATAPALRQQWIDTSAELLQGLARLEAVRYRIQAYMLPRIPALDSFALAAAMRQGDVDFQESKAVGDQCATECNAPPATSQPPLVCGASCGNQASLSRVSACAKPTWLPP